MSNQSTSAGFNFLQQLGLMVFVFLCGFPALALNGFLSAIPMTLGVALLCATVGGAVGGMMLCPRPLLAGLVGGLLAGPLGLLAVYYYTQGRQEVHTLELVLVQGVACLPGVGVGWLLMQALSASPPRPRGRDEEEEDY